MRFFIQINIILIILFLSLSVKADITLNSNSASEIIPYASVIRLANDGNKILFVGFVPNKQSLPADLSKWLKEILKLDQYSSLELEKEEQDKYGFTHYRFRQYYKGIPVEDARFYVHVKDAFVESINGDIRKINASDETPRIDFNTARSLFITENNIDERAVKKNKKDYELVFLNQKDVTQLCYKTEIYLPEKMYRSYIYLDALTGKKILERTRIASSSAIGTAYTKYSGQRNIVAEETNDEWYILQDVTRGNGIRTQTLYEETDLALRDDIYDGDNIWNMDSSSYDAHFNAEQAYDLFQNYFGRSSYDNLSSAISVITHYGVNVENAYWDGEHILCAGASSVKSVGSYTSTPIIGHEFTHGVTESSAGLVYAFESGALNEAFSDMMGVLLDSITNPGTNYWLIGDELSTVLNYGFRDLSDPQSLYSPDTYLGTYWDSNFMQPHINSGVANYWFYLLSAGGNGINDNDTAYAVRGIGLVKAAQIAYRCLTTYLTPGSDYSDARFYSIQAAIDLYGNCSPEVIQCTNAWNAVGVGARYTDAVVSHFLTVNPVNCSAPATVNFNSFCTNADTYEWNFGDNTFSSLPNPSHVYVNPGLYTVQLVVSGNSLCNTSDTLTHTNEIIVTTSLASPAPSCALPVSDEPNRGNGIYEVHFAEINNKSSTHEINSDYSCFFQANLVAGNTYPIKINTNKFNRASVKVFIDYNNNLTFDLPEEEVFFSDFKIFEHEGYVHTPPNAVTGIPLRMRVYSDSASFVTSINGCNQIIHGECEDYSIVFSPSPAVPPVADFISDKNLANINSDIQFDDLSYNSPTTWSWFFPGGTPSVSNLQNPLIHYNVNGSYSVTLIASNAFGSDTITKDMYINVVDYYILGNSATTTASCGVLFDTGGPFGLHGQNQHLPFAIFNTNGGPIKIYFTQFNTGFATHFYIYDKINPAHLIAEYNEFSVPNNDTLTITTNECAIVFVSNNYMGPGFEMHWTTDFCGMDSLVAAIETDTVPLFAQNTTFKTIADWPTTKWEWDFGDGTFSNIKDPEHTYYSSGLKTVKLIASNFTFSDTVYKNIVVQEPPQIGFPHDTLSVTLNCGDTASVSFTVNNNGMGNLILHLDSTQQKGKNQSLQILALGQIAAQSQLYAFIKATLDSLGIDYHLTSDTSAATVSFKEKINKYDVVIVSDKFGSYSVNPVIRGILSEYIAKGGYVISFNYEGLVAGGIFPVAASVPTNNYYVNQNSNQQLTAGLPDTIVSVQGIRFVDADYVNLYKCDNQSIFGYHQSGGGVAFYMQTLQSAVNKFDERFFIRTIKWIKNRIESGTVLYTDSTDELISGGDSSLINIHVNGSLLTVGDTLIAFNFNTNDTAYTQNVKYVKVTLNGSAELLINQSCVLFDSLKQGNIQQKYLAIANIGCDTLKIDSLLISGTAFTISESNFSIPPHQNDSIQISFQPQLNISYNEILSIYSNDIDTTVCLIGKGLAGPLLYADRDTIKLNVSCGSLTNIPFTIYNNGLAPLNYQVRCGDSLNVLFMENMVSQLQMDHEINSMRSNFNNFRIYRINTQIPSVIKSELKGKDMVIFPSVSAYTANYDTACGNVIRNFISKGHVGVLHGGERFSGITMGLLNAPSSGGSTINITCNVSDTLHPLTLAIPKTFISSKKVFYNNYTDVNYKSLIQIGNLNIAGYKNFGKGYLVYNGFNYEIVSPEIEKLASNTAQWAYNVCKKDSILNVDIHSGILQPGDSVVITGSCDSQGFTAGHYNSSFYVYSDDAENQMLEIPISINVRGNPSIAFKDSCYQLAVYDTLIAFDSVMVKNTGCDTLHITNVSVAAPLQLLNFPSVIPPFNTAWIYVSCYTGTSGIFSSSILINNDDRDTILCVEINSAGIPLAEFANAPVTITMGCNEKDSLLVKLYNRGASPLIISPQNNSADSLRILIDLIGIGGNGFINFFGNEVKKRYSLSSIRENTLTDSTLLRAALQNENVLVIPNPNNGVNFSVYKAIEPVILDFVKQGGYLFICQPLYAYSGILHTEMFNADMKISNQKAMLQVNDDDHFIAESFNTNIRSTFSSFEFSDSSISEIITYNGKPVYSIKKVGNGAIFQVGLSEVYNQLYGRTIEWIAKAFEKKKIECNSGTITILPGDSVEIKINFQTDSTGTGVYNDTPVFNSNQPGNNKLLLPVLLNVNQKVAAYFRYNHQACEGPVHFVSLPLGEPTSYYWNFGDGYTSTLAFPDHFYSASGSYDVMLVVCNAINCDTVIRKINVSVNGLKEAACIPLGGSYYWITTVELNNLDNSSATTDSSGFEDYTCLAPAELIEGEMSPLVIKSFGNLLSAWLDFNNDGDFSMNEMYYLTQNHGIDTIRIIPPGNVLNTPLRMRLATAGSSLSTDVACTAINNTVNFEDYAFKILPATVVPVAAFSNSISGDCSGKVNFVNQSLHGGMYIWDFGDGTIDTIFQTNLSHTYLADGSYTVKLTAVNSMGRDSISSSITLHVMQGSISYTGNLITNSPIQFNANVQPGTSVDWEFETNAPHSSLPVASYTFTSGGGHMIKLTISDTLGCSRIQFLSVQIGLNTGLEQFETKNNVSVNPNPFKDQSEIKISLAKKNHVEISILTIDGKLIREIDKGNLSAGTYTFETGKLEPGFYLMNVKYDDEIHSFKLVSIR